MSLPVILDGGADVPRGEEDLIRIPLNIEIAGEHYEYPGIPKERVIGTILKNPPGSVKTSQPSPKQIMSAVEAVVEESGSREVLYIALSSGVSGTYNVARVVSRMLEKKDIKLHVFDSKSLSGGIYLLARQAMSMAESGASVEEILHALERLRPRIHVYFTVPSLNYLVAGGRIDPFRAMVAKVFGILPIVHVDSEGRLSLFATAKKKKVFSELADVVSRELGDGEPVFMAYTPCAEGYDELLLEQLRFRDIEPHWRELLSPILTAHAGPCVAGAGFVARPDATRGDI